MAREKICWYSLDAQGENPLPLQDWFYPDLENIRNEGEIPQALVERRKEKIPKGPLSRIEGITDTYAGPRKIRVGSHGAAKALTYCGC